MAAFCGGKQSEAGILVLGFVSEMSPQASVLLACFPSGGAVQGGCEISGRWDLDVGSGSLAVASGSCLYCLVPDVLCPDVKKAPPHTATSPLPPYLLHQKELRLSGRASQNKQKWGSRLSS